MPALTWLRLVCAVSLLGALPAAAHAQTVRGRVTAGDGASARGATVLLLDSAGRTRGGTFVDAAGAFSITTSSAGRYVLEVQRIGLRNTRSDWFTLAAGQTLQMPMVVSVEAVVLPELEAIGRSRCGRSNDARVAAVWEEARKALHAAALAARAQLYQFEIRRHYRRLALPSLQVVRDSTAIQRSVHSGSPFASVPADSLIRYGFIQEKRDGTYYRGPDAEVLLSESFANAFCFYLKANARANLIGLAFEPVRRNTESSITGTLWIDRAASELRFLEYKYVGWAVPRAAMGLLGGRIDLRRLPDGPWIVEKWNIRMPLFAETEVAAVRGSPLRHVVLKGLSEEGAEVLTTNPRR